MKLYLIFFVLVSFSGCKEKPSTFSWSYQSCRYEGKYNNQLYSRSQMQNLLLLVKMDTILKTSFLASNFSDIDKLSTDKLKQEYDIQKEFLDNLDVIDNTYWNYLHKERKLQLEEEYYLKKIVIQSYRNPEKLLMIKDRCKEYAQLLNNEKQEEILKASQKLTLEMDSLIGNAASETYSSPKELEDAKVNLIEYGWWRCAKRSIHNANDRNIAHKAFTGMFTNIEIVCN